MFKKVHSTCRHTVNGLWIWHMLLFKQIILMLQLLFCCAILNEGPFFKDWGFTTRPVFEPCVAFLRILATLLDGWDPHGYNKAQRMNRMVWKSDAEKRDCTMIKGVRVFKGFLYLFVYFYLYFREKKVWKSIRGEERGRKDSIRTSLPLHFCMTRYVN